MIDIAEQQAPKGTAVDLAALKRRFHASAYPNCRETVIDGTFGREDALAAARSMVTQRYPKLLCAFAYGSGATGVPKPYSDIDVSIILPEGEAWTVNCVEEDGFLFDVHCYPLPTLDIMLAFAKFSGIMAGLAPGGGSLVLADPGQVADGVLERLRDTFHQGPLARSDGALAALRFRLTSALSDLFEVIEPTEGLTVGVAVYDAVVKLVQAQDCAWQHSGKWVARTVKQVRPSLVPELAQGMAAACNGDPAILASVALEVLEKAGGGYWVGYESAYRLADEATLMPLIASLKNR